MEISYQTKIFKNRFSLTFVFRKKKNRFPGSTNDLLYLIKVKERFIIRVDNLTILEDTCKNSYVNRGKKKKFTKMQKNSNSNYLF